MENYGNGCHMHAEENLTRFPQTRDYTQINKTHIRNASLSVLIYNTSVQQIPKLFECKKTCQTGFHFHVDWKEKANIPLLKPFQPRHCIIPSNYSGTTGPFHSLICSAFSTDSKSHQNRHRKSATRPRNSITAWRWACSKKDFPWYIHLHWIMLLGMADMNAFPRTFSFLFWFLNLSFSWIVPLL